MTGLRQRLSLILGSTLLMMALVWIWPFRLQPYLTSAEGTRPTQLTQNVAIIGLIESTPPDKLPLALRAVNSQMLTVTISQQQPSLDGRTQMPALAWAARENLSSLGVRQVTVSTVGRTEDSNRRPVRLDALLPDGRYLSIEAQEGMLRYRLGMRLVFGTLAAIGLIGSIALWLLLWQLRPLEQLVTAVEHFGKTLNAPSITSEGAFEVQQLVAAFNRMQQQIRALVDSRSRMMAAISHDLGTYLTRLRLRVEYLEPLEQRERAIADVENMQSLIEDTLSLGRLDRDGGGDELIDFAALADRHVSAMNDDRVRFCTEGSAWVRGRRHALLRVLDNLISNALKYASGAEVSVENLGADPKGTVELRVEDRGPGIPAKARELVLEPFYRGDSARNLDIAGSGLGLAIVADIVKRHHGRLALDDRAGGGLSVRVTLPAAAQA